MASQEELYRRQQQMNMTQSQYGDMQPNLSGSTGGSYGQSTTNPSASLDGGPATFNSSGEGNSLGVSDKQSSGQGIGATAAGVAQVIATPVAGTAASKALQTNAPGQQTDAYGRPVYNLGDFAAQTNGIKPKNPQLGQWLGAQTTGFAKGFETGGWIGGVIEGSVAGISNHAKQISLRNRLRKKKRLATANLNAANDMYNTGTQQFNNQQMAQSDYNYYNDPNTRTNNIYNANTPV